MSRPKERIVDVEITSFSKNGHGIGAHENENGTRWIIEVPFTIPGDRVRAKLLRKKGENFTSLLEQILEPSTHRKVPKCIHFASCGGCRWQQQSYEQQLMNKEEIVRHSFRSFAFSEECFRPMIPCDPPWYYRNKMEFSFSANALKEQFLGLVMNAGRGKVVNLQECHLVDSWFINALKSVRQWWAESTLEAYHPYRNTGSLRTLTMREGKRTGDRMVILTVSGNADYALNKNQLDAFVSAVRSAIEPLPSESKLSIFLRIQQIAKGVRTNFYEILLHGPTTIREVLRITEQPNVLPQSLSFEISPMAFFQPNTQQAEKLYSHALQMIAIHADSVVYDLYCGTGTLGICVAKRAKQVIGIEIAPEAVLDARSNAQLNQLTNVTVFEGDVGTVLEKIKRENIAPLPHVVMVDPPRMGLDAQAIQQILELHAATILYISCNPLTQARDVGLFLNGGYQIEAIQPVDQFPQTVHIENIVILKKPA